MRFRNFKDITFCERCRNESISVQDTRIVEKIRRRRRICTLCGHRTTTYEIRKEDLEMLSDMVVAACNETYKKIDKVTEEKMSKYSALTGGFGGLF